MDIEKVKKSLLAPRKRRPPIEAKDLLGTGSTLLNFACTGKAQGGFAKGHYFFIVGDSVSGKTWLSLTCLAEASISKRFDDYRFIFDDAEGGALMEVERFFGKAVADRMEPPEVDDEGEPVYSRTDWEFYFHVDDAVKDGRPFIYVLDSQDSLSGDAELGKFDERKKANREGRDIAGSFGDGKAKVHSGNIRKLLGPSGPLQETGSILIVIGQTRDSFEMYQSKTYSGGRALRFYATLQIWSSVKRRLHHTVRGKKRQVGVLVKLEVKKNRITGRERTVYVPILHASGIDDTGSCVDYLLDEGHWKGTSKKLDAPDLGFSGSREALVQHVEEGGLEKDLRGLVAEVWRRVERDSKYKRKPRY